MVGAASIALLAMCHAVDVYKLFLYLISSSTFCITSFASISRTGSFGWLAPGIGQPIVVLILIPPLVARPKIV